MSTKSCIFCSIISGQQSGAQVYRDSNFLVLMDKYPINRGHTLVIPTKHYENILQMPPADVGRLYSIIPAVAKAVVSVVKADGFNVGQNNGIAANQIVPHVHVHVVPRFEDDSPDGRWPARSVAHSDDLANVAKKIKDKLILSLA
jgi:histidine triad (HIT) family protein